MNTGHFLGAQMLFKHDQDLHLHVLALYSRQ